MNQTCKVCGEPAAGFHFGAFTCEGCKSFFGRSYNKLSSINKCKNNGKCIMNKKNRTDCKACRLKKSLMVGMSKKHSRFGRRSNSFKIQCLLQQQQEKAVAGQGNNVTPPPSTLRLGHTSYMQSIHARPPRSKEEPMQLGFAHNKHPSDSISVSSPDSHNSNSSVEVGDRRNSLLRQQMPGGRDTMPQLYRELFLPFCFPGLPMPPSGFLPPSYPMFPGHPALYAQHQSLLKTVMNTSSMLNSRGSSFSFCSSAVVVNNNTRLVPNYNSISEEQANRYFWNEELKSKRSPLNVPIKDINAEEDLEVLSKRSQSPTTLSAVSSQSANQQGTSLPFEHNFASKSVPPVSTILAQDVPIDLSVNIKFCRKMSPIGESDLSSDGGPHRLAKKSRNHFSRSKASDDFNYNEGKR